MSFFPALFRAARQPGKCALPQKMKNQKKNTPLLYLARFFGYTLLLAGFVWLFLAVPMATRVVDRKVIERSNARIAARPQSTFTTRDMENEVRASVQDTLELYPGHFAPTFLMAVGGLLLAYSPSIKLVLPEEPASRETVAKRPAQPARRARQVPAARG